MKAFSLRVSAVLGAVVSLFGSAQAQAQAPAPAPMGVQLYGTVDLAVGQLANQNPGPPTTGVTKIKGVINGGVQTSYWGIRGSEDLGGGLTAKFALESFFQADTGTQGRFGAVTNGPGADLFFSRLAFVGLAGGFGELRLGNNANPTWVSMLQTNALGASSVFSPSFRQLYNGGTRGLSEVDTAMVNSVSYSTPMFAGVSATGVLQAGEGSGTGSNYSANVSYRGGPVFVTAAMQKVRAAEPPNLAGNRDQRIVLLGGSYNFGVVKLFGQYTTVKNPRPGVNRDDKLLHVGLSAPIANGELQLSTGTDKAENATSGASLGKRTTTTLGYLYPLSKRTTVYGIGMREKFPVGLPNNLTSQSGSSYVLGIKHTF